jgi:hypothetical protein
MLQYGFKEQRVTRKTGCRLGEVCIEFELARIRSALRFLIQYHYTGTRKWNLERTSTNCANAGFELFSFSNSYLPYS